MGAEISRDEMQFRLDVTGKLATLIAQTSDLAEQVRRQNGNVARLWSEMDKVKEHPAACPWQKRVGKIEQAMAGHAAAKVAAGAASGKWERWVRPVVIAAVTFVLGMWVRALVAGKIGG